MYSRILALTLSITCVAVGLGDVTVREWSGISGTKFQVTYPDPNDPNVVRIRIVESDNGTFSFEAFYTGTNNAADVDRIETDPSGVTGTVRLKVAPDPNYPAREYGAATVKQIDLTTADTGEIAGILISADLATEGDVICGNVTGDVYIGGDLGNLGSPYTEFSAGDVTGSFTISGDLWDDVTVNTLADFAAGDSTGSTVDGDIAIAQGYSATMTINDLFGGAITVGAEMSGLIDINRNMVNASITIGTPGANANLTGGIETRAIGTILVNGNVSSGGLIDGQTFLNGRVQVTGDLSGAIVIDSEIASPGRILIAGDLTSTGLSLRS